MTVHTLMRADAATEGDIGTALTEGPTCEVTLGVFLRERRSRLQPAADAAPRRRTPGLRREEVAARANVSVVWYTWLEQGRGGAPSDDVLERLAVALEFDAAGREMLFLLAQRRPPPLDTSPLATVTSQMQRVLDGMPTSPALIKTPTWDVVAWNEAAACVLGNYESLTPQERNVLRRMFGSAAIRDALPDWEANARLVVEVFRIDVARSGANSEALALADELRTTSEDFRRLWAEHDVRDHGSGIKRLRHPVAGLIELGYSTYAIEGSKGLSMVVFTPMNPEATKKVEDLLARKLGPVHG